MSAALPNQPNPTDAEVQLTALIEDHRQAVHALLCKRYIGALDKADIDDVIQTATHRMWTHSEKLPELRSPRAWFVRVADNVAKDVLRFGWQKARQLEVSVEPEWLNSLPEKPRVLPDPDELPDQSLVKALREIVASLPEAQQRIVWADALNPHGPLPSETLAKELDIPPGTVRVYRKRGLEKIRTELEKRNLTLK